MEAERVMLQNLLGYLEAQKFHPSASHVPPDYRDGYNRALDVVIDRTQTELSLLSAAVEEGEGEPRTLSRIDAQWWMDNRANVIAALSAKGLQIVSNAEHVWIAPQKGSA